MHRYTVTVVLMTGESFSYVRYGFSAADITDMVNRNSPSAVSITVES